MPSAEPTKTFLVEGGSECEEIKVTHSNKLQEAKFYTYQKKRPDENNPLKFYLQKLGNSVQPGDPVTLTYTVTGDGHIRVIADNEDNNETGQAGSATFISDDPETGSYNLVWPCQFELVGNTSIGKFDDGWTLRARSQAPNYRPGYLSDAEIEADYFFVSLYEGWLVKRSDDYYADTGTYPLPPEEYEIANERQRIIAEVRAFLSVQWADWFELKTTYETFRSGTYWTGGRYEGGGGPIYANYSFRWTPEISPKLLGADGVEVGEEGVDPTTLIAYEFVSERGLDIDDINDWTEALRINFMGTPAPLTIECTEPCEEGCLPLYQNATRLCICKDVKVNETDDYDYQPYDHNQSKPRLNDFNP
jgi:hypothetical protein